MIEVERTGDQPVAAYQEIETYTNESRLASTEVLPALSLPKKWLVTSRKLIAGRWYVMINGCVAALWACNQPQQAHTLLSGERVDQRKDIVSR